MADGTHTSSARGPDSQQPIWLPPRNAAQRPLAHPCRSEARRTRRTRKGNSAHAEGSCDWIEVRLRADRGLHALTNRCCWVEETSREDLARPRMLIVKPAPDGGRPRLSYRRSRSDNRDGHYHARATSGMTIDGRHRRDPKPPPVCECAGGGPAPVGSFPWSDCIAW